LYDRKIFTVLVVVAAVVVVVVVENVH